MSRLQLMQIVDDQDKRLDVVSDLREDAVDHLVNVWRGNWCSLCRAVDRGRRGANRVQHGPPELLAGLAALYGHVRDSANVGRAVSPCMQQRGLPTSRRRRNHGDAFGDGAVEQMEQIL